MSSQATVHSIDALKELRTALVLYGEDTLGALGAVEAEVRRTMRWLQDERPYYWQEQIKRRREQVGLAKSELFRRQLQKRPDYTPPMSEQKENLRKAEASLQDAEKRLAMVRKWQPLYKQAVLEYHASVQRLKDLSASDVPRAVNLLSRLIDALESYLRIAPPSGLGLEPGLATGGAPAPFVSIATEILDADAAIPADVTEAAVEKETIGEDDAAQDGAEKTASNNEGTDSASTPA
ncbi:MAG: hypothetical protein ACLQIB_36785 [Isosphaeraceae bacterium]